ncbi:signal peptidase I [Lachnoclostridium phytofermentans ISDg]|uniref:Signal peptidase I n=2 Tax=Lachnoclostridium phytofermentans TaxID=66219 RepID=A9KLL9_LACP7|nr:signal peptidase I [Lachnoclostridium phytofermentans ISDg]
MVISMMKYDFDRDIKRKKRKKLYIRIIIWMVEIVAVIALAYAIINVALEKTTMLGESMEITLQDEDKIVINKLAYKFRDPKRYDIIVFKQSGNEHSYYNIKRVIGLPGERVKILDGVVYVNGEALEEPMVVDPIRIPGLADEEFTLDEDEFFVLGDNRNNSEDSRFANIGNVVKDDIIGKAWIRLNPFGIVNKINMYSKSVEENVEGEGKTSGE